MDLVRGRSFSGDEYQQSPVVRGSVGGFVDIDNPVLGTAQDYERLSDLADVPLNASASPNTRVEDTFIFALEERGIQRTDEHNQLLTQLRALRITLNDLRTTRNSLNNMTTDPDAFKAINKKIDSTIIEIAKTEGLIQKILNGLPTLNNLSTSRSDNTVEPSRTRRLDKALAVLTGVAIGIGIATIVTAALSNPVGWVILGAGLLSAAALLLSTDKEQHKTLIPYIALGTVIGAVSLWATPVIAGATGVSQAGQALATDIVDTVFSFALATLWILKSRTFASRPPEQQLSDDNPSQRLTAELNELDQPIKADGDAYDPERDDQDFRSPPNSPNPLPL